MGPPIYVGHVIKFQKLNTAYRAIKAFITFTGDESFYFEIGTGHETEVSQGMMKI